jgi:O-acetylhomoserine/O-acetylserine sulfhydrylase-like pyridoxal-dependent enzyme
VHIFIQVAAAIRPNTRMVWIETPTNPTLKLVDIQAVADIAHNARKDMIVCVDNTFESAYFQVCVGFFANFEYFKAKFATGIDKEFLFLLFLNTIEFNLFLI